MGSQKTWLLVPLLPFTSIMIEATIAELITSLVFQRVLVLDVSNNRPQMEGDFDLPHSRLDCWVVRDTESQFRQ